MHSIDKAARGIVIIAAAACAIAAHKIDQHIDALTQRDLELAEIAYQQSGAQQAAEALVVWQMRLEGRCAPSVPQAAALPCPPSGAYWRAPVQAETVWSVGPAVRRGAR
jgi:hypothetical protein